MRTIDGKSVEEGPGISDDRTVWKEWRGSMTQNGIVAQRSVMAKRDGRGGIGGQSRQSRDRDGRGENWQGSVTKVEEARRSIMAEHDGRGGNMVSDSRT